jgi:hypothetical protein
MISKTATTSRPSLFANFDNIQPMVEVTDDILQRIRERSYQLWEQEERPEGRHLHHWLQAEEEFMAECGLSIEFKQLMRAFRSGIISEKTVDRVMTDLERRALTAGIKASV